MMIVPVYPKDAAKRWPQLRRYISKASRGVESITSLRSRTVTGQLWLAEVIHRDEVVGAVLFEPMDDCLHITSLGADGLPKGWAKEFYRQWASLARSTGRHTLSLKGRKGWQRILPPLGFHTDDDGYMRARA